MILVDTAVWIDHFRKKNDTLKNLLMQGCVATHPLVIGELACGHFKRRRDILDNLQALPSSMTLGHDELLYFIEQRNLMGLGIGIVDVHLLASSILSKFPLWTVDKRLKKAAQQLNTHYENTC